MERPWPCIAAAGFSVLLGGCAVRPLPEDVAGLSSYAISQQIRCEARDAIRDFAVRTISINNPGVAARLRTDPRLFIGYNWTGLDPETTRVLRRYANASVAYDFTFDITETNTENAGLSLVDPVTRGTIKVELGAGNVRQRQNIQNFKVADTFDHLATEMPERYCAEARLGSNLQYPISGSVGMAKAIGHFLDMNQSGNLVGSSLNPNVPSTSETIVFTTTISGGLDPKVVLAAVGSAPQITEAGFSASSSRVDKHRLVLAFALDPKDIERKGVTISEQRAIEEIDRQKKEQREDKELQVLEAILN